MKAKDNLTSLINIAKRVHHTESKRTEILDDLKAITEKEYEAIESCSLIDTHSAELLMQLINEEIAVVNAIHEEQCFICSDRDMPPPEKPTERLDQLSKLKQLLNL